MSTAIASRHWNGFSLGEEISLDFGVAVVAAFVVVTSTEWVSKVVQRQKILQGYLRGAIKFVIVGSPWLN